MLTWNESLDLFCDTSPEGGDCQCVDYLPIPLDRDVEGLYLLVQPQTVFVFDFIQGQLSLLQEENQLKEESRGKQETKTQLSNCNRFCLFLFLGSDTVLGFQCDKTHWRQKYKPIGKIPWITDEMQCKLQNANIRKLEKPLFCVVPNEIEQRMEFNFNALIVYELVSKNLMFL